MRYFTNSGKLRVNRKTKLDQTNNECELCKIIANHVHHKDRNRRNNDISNLLVVCVKCHKLIHRSTPIRDKMILVRLGRLKIMVEDHKSGEMILNPDALKDYKNDILILEYLLKGEE